MPERATTAADSCRARSDVSLRVVGGEAILHDPVARATHVVNGSAARVWELCDGRSLDELVAAFGASYGREADAVRDDVVRVVDSFRRLGLLA
jgi:hypothetical protein